MATKRSREKSRKQFTSLVQKCLLIVTVASALLFFLVAFSKLEDKQTQQNDHMLRPATPSRELSVVTHEELLAKTGDEHGGSPVTSIPPLSHEELLTKTGEGHRGPPVTSNPPVSDVANKKLLAEMGYEHWVAPQLEARPQACVNDYENRVKPLLSIDLSSSGRRQNLRRSTRPFLNTSVIFTFCNEHKLSLFASIHSVIAMSPRALLHEIILVDDGSDTEHLAAPRLENNCQVVTQATGVPIRVVHLKKRSGLMRARVAGAKVATGDTITVLDSHISCSTGWLEPLMERLYHYPKHVVMPSIDGISPEWKYQTGGIEVVGWNTGLVDHGIPVQENHKIPGSPTPELDPKPSPAMAGGLFSIGREWFWEIGGFDEGMGFWGGENVEIGFRVWQCGGKIEWIQCSHVGHVWGGMPGRKQCRPQETTISGSTNVGQIEINKWRAIEVWMDDEKYKNLMRKFIPYPNGGVGSLEQMRAVKEKLQCKPFSYYLEQAYPENWMDKILSARLFGSVKNVGTGNCLNFRPQAGSRDGNQLTKIESCRELGLMKSHSLIKWGSQYNMQWAWLTKTNQILLNVLGDDLEHCLEAPGSIGSIPRNYGCHPWKIAQGSNQHWEYNDHTQQLIHRVYNMCLAAPLGASDASQNPTLQKCNAEDILQKWKWHGGSW